MEFKVEPTTSTIPLDSILGMEIYNDLKKYGTISSVTKLSIYDPENISKVSDEIDNIIVNRYNKDYESFLDIATILKDFPEPKVIENLLV